MGGIQTKDCHQGKEGSLAIKGAVCPFTPTGPWPRATSLRLDRLFVKNRLRAVASDRAGVWQGGCYLRISQLLSVI